MCHYLQVACFFLHYSELTINTEDTLFFLEIQIGSSSPIVV
uniref:Uncharacterized protein n=1 Tax=Anguilla anguilla TaxID=7936 RepID=A0A0E9XNJ9_ANGAN